MSGERRRASGELASRVLRILRSRAGWATVRDVQGELLVEREIAYTTVLTVLQRLVRQGLVEHRREGRAGAFRIGEAGDPTGARSVVDQALARFGTMAVAQFVEQSREDPALLAELRRQLEALDAADD